MVAPARRRSWLVFGAVACAVAGWPLAPPSAGATEQPSGPTLWVDTTGLEFGPVTVGEASDPLEVGIHNAGDAEVTGLTVGGPDVGFSASSTCGATLAPGATCTVAYRFAPTATGDATAASEVSWADGSTTVAMTGRGVAAVHPLLVVTEGLDFGTVRSPGTTVPEAITVVNPTASPVSFQVTGLTATGEFTAAAAATSAGCGGAPKVLAAGASCRIDVAMASVTPGPHSGTASFTLAPVVGAAWDESVPLAGTGAQGLVLSPTRLDFGVVALGTESAPLTTTLTNTGSAALPYATIDVPEVPGFEVATDCPVDDVLDPGERCTLTYRFVPTATATSATATDTAVTLTPEVGPAAALPLTLVGQGVAGLVVSRSGVDLGEVAVGSTSAAGAIELTNVSPATIEFDATASVPAGPFAVGTGTCTGSLAPGDRCSFPVTFAPVAAGASTATASVVLDVAGDAPTVTRPVSLRGTGTSATPFPIQVDTSAIDFGPVVAGRFRTVPVVVRNTSAAPVTATLTGQVPPNSTLFHVSNGCGSSVTLDPGGSCTLSYSLAPPAAGGFSAFASPVVVVDGTSRTSFIPMAGVGIVPLAIQQGGLAFGTRYLYVRQNAPSSTVATTSQDLTVANTWSGSVSFIASGLSAPALSGITLTTNECVGPSGTPVTLGAGDSCLVTAELLPLVEGPSTATMSVSLVPTAAGAGRSFTVPLTWSGAFPWRLSATGLDLGRVDVGATSASRTVSGRTLISGVGFGGLGPSGGGATAPFASSFAFNNSPFGFGASMDLSATFSPTAPGEATGSASVSVTVGAATHTFPVSLRGTGASTDPELVVPTSAVDLGPVAQGDTATRTITVRNAGRSAISGLTLADATGSGLSLTGSCPTIAPGATCDLVASLTGDGSDTAASLTPVLQYGGTTHAVSLRGYHLRGATAPAAPTAVAATAGESSATVSWAAPDDGGGPITGYVVTPYVDGVAQTPRTFASADTSQVVAGLEEGVPVAFTVAAVNAVGTGPASSPSAAVTPTGPTPPGLWVDTTGLDLGPVAVGGHSTAQVVGVHNRGADAITGLAVGDPGPPFELTTDCGSTLVPGGSCSVSVSLAPTGEGAVTATVPISSSDGDATVALRGSGVVAGFPLTVDPVGLDFGSQPTPGTTAAQQVVVANRTAAPVSFALQSAATTGQFTTDRGDCSGSPKTLAPGASCHLDVRMASTTVAAHTGTESFTLAVVGGASRAFAIPLAGTGTKGLRLSPGRLDFGLVPVGTTSAPQTVTLTNTGDPLSYSSLSVPTLARYDRTVSCPPGSVLPTGGSCTITYRYQPSTVTFDTTSTTITLTSSAGAVSTFPLTLGGQMVTALRVAPTGLDFGDVAVGSTSARTVTVTNVTSSTVGFDATASVPGSPTYTVANDSCTGSLAPDASCTFTITYAPTAAATNTSSTTLSLDWTSTPAATTTQVVTVTGKGVADAASRYPLVFDTRALNFGAVAQGTTSPTYDVSITNTSGSSVTATLGALSVSSPWSLVNECGTSFTLAPGARCRLRYAFAPTASTNGTVTSSSNISMTVDGVNRALNLSYTAVATTPLNVVQTSLDFGNVYRDTLGACSADGCVGQDSQAIAVSNPTRAAVSFTGSFPSPATGVTVTRNDCAGSPKVLASGASCLVWVHLSPASVGAGSATMTATITPSGGSAKVASIPITWVGLSPWRLSATAVDFGDVAVGATATRTVSLVAASPFAQAAPTPTLGAAPTADLDRSFSCPGSTVPAGGACTLTLTYRPTAPGSDAGDQAVDVPVGSVVEHLVVHESGAGHVDPTLQLSPTGIDFGTVASRATVERTVTVRNTTGATVDGVSVTGGQGRGLALEGSCGPLAPGQACDLLASMTGTGVGAATHLTATVVVGGTTRAVDLRGYHTLATPPGAPTAVAAVAGDGEATVTWSPPADDGGFDIVAYVVAPYLDGSPQVPYTVPAATTSAVIGGLANWHSYTFTVAALNQAGTGPSSAPSAAVVPTGVVVPGAPTGVTAVAGSTRATVSWTAPASDGGSPVTGYVVTPIRNGVAQAPSSFSSTATTQEVAGLVNGGPYTFVVAAVNAVGTGPASTPSAPVTPVGVVLTSDANPAVLGQPVTVRAQSTVGNSGTMYFYDGATLLGWKTTSGGAAALALPRLAVGPHALVARFQRNNTTTTVSSDPVVQTIDRGPTAVGVSFNPTTSVFGQAVKVKATVTAVAPATGTPAGSVSFYDGSSLLQTVALSAGSASFSGALPGGVHTITATYAGNGSWAPGSSPARDLLVDPAQTTTTLTSSPATSALGEVVTLKAKVTAVAPATGTPGGYVSFYDGALLLETKRLSDGAANLKVQPSVGAHDLRAVYLASGNYLGSSATVVQVVGRGSVSVATSSPYPTTTLGHSGKVSVTVAPTLTGTGATPTGTVALYDDGALLATLPLSAGKGTYAIASFPVGVHHLTATYDGDGNFLAGATTVAFTQTIT
jgi:hypothetical protein